MNKAKKKDYVSFPMNKVIENGRVPGLDSLVFLQQILETMSSESS